MKKLFNNSYNKQIDGTGLAIFRIAYSIILLCEIMQMFYFRHLIFDKIPYIELPEISSAIPILIWAVSVVFIMVGLFTRTATIINYIMSLVLIGTINTYEYHVFYAYMGINFLLMFMPISQCLSIDRLIKKEKYKQTNPTYNPPKKVRQLYYFLPVYVAIALIYFDSIFMKLGSKSWVDGLGLWMPASFPMMTHSNLSFILNNKSIVIFLGYLTLVFEAVFIFLFFRKKFRTILFIIGIGLHIGILIVFPIPWFALTYCSIYILLIPVSFFKLEREKSNTVANLESYCTYKNKDIHKRILFYIIVFFTISQIAITYNSIVANELKNKIGFSNTTIDNGLLKISKLTNSVTKILFGITGHSVFIDQYHYIGYNHIISVIYQNKNRNTTWLPIINKNGQPSYYNYGTNWRKISFSTNAPNINMNNLNKGVRDFTAFWAY